MAAITRRPRTRLLAVSEVAEILAVHPHTVYRYLTDGLLPFVLIGGSKRVPDDALWAYIDAHTYPAIPEHRPRRGRR